MSLEVQLMNVQEQPSNIKREIRAAIEVNFNQLFLIRSGSWDQPRRYVPPERLCFYKQPSSGSLSWLGPQTWALIWAEASTWLYRLLLHSQLIVFRFSLSHTVVLLKILISNLNMKRQYSSLGACFWLFFMQVIFIYWDISLGTLAKTVEKYNITGLSLQMIGMYDTCKFGIDTILGKYRPSIILELISLISLPILTLSTLKAACCHVWVCASVVCRTCVSLTESCDQTTTEQSRSKVQDGKGAMFTQTCLSFG